MPMLRQNVEEIERLAEKIKQEREGTISELIDRLHGISNELDVVWDERSRQAFSASYGDWIQQLEKFSDTLNNVNQYLVSAATNFRDLNTAADQAHHGTTAPQ